MYDEILLDTEERMDKALDHLRNNLAGIERRQTLSRRLYPEECYGSQTPLKQLANVGCPEPQQIAARPYDPSVIKDIEKAIVASDPVTILGDGRLIRINVLALSGEVRKKMVTRIKELSEEAKVSIRKCDEMEIKYPRVKKTTP